MMPIPDLQRAERRAGHLSRLEAEKWILPTAGPLPRWQDLPLERCTITRAARQTLSGQLAVLEGYAADSSPMAELGALAQRKQALQASKDAALQRCARNWRMAPRTAQCRPAWSAPAMPGELRRQLLKGKAPGHEWVLCAGLALVGSLAGLAFVRELVGLDPMTLMLDGEQVHGKELQITANLRIESADLSGQTSNTATAHKGFKPKGLTVSLMIPLR